jgi:hypothetical protein
VLLGTESGIPSLLQTSDPPAPLIERLAVS